MKKLLLPIFAVLFFIAFTACEKESAAKPATGKDLSIQSRTTDKVHICHNGHIIYVSVNALPAHLNHLWGSDAVDMDNDGYYNKENDCNTPVDCNDEDPNYNIEC